MRLHLFLYNTTLTCWHADSMISSSGFARCVFRYCLLHCRSVKCAVVVALWSATERDNKHGASPHGDIAGLRPTSHGQTPAMPCPLSRTPTVLRMRCSRIPARAHRLLMTTPSTQCLELASHVHCPFFNIHQARSWTQLTHSLQVDVTDHVAQCVNVMSSMDAPPHRQMPHGFGRVTAGFNSAWHVPFNSVCVPVAYIAVLLGHPWPGASSGEVLLLLFCASPRANYMFRMLPPGASEAFAREHDAAVCACFATLLSHDSLPPQPLPHPSHRLAQLPLRFGGFGVRSAVDAARSAYGAS